MEERRRTPAGPPPPSASYAVDADALLASSDDDESGMAEAAAEPVYHAMGYLPSEDMSTARVLPPDHVNTDNHPIVEATSVSIVPEGPESEGGAAPPDRVNAEHCPIVEAASVSIVQGPEGERGPAAGDDGGPCKMTAPGTKVRIHGLARASHHNGAVGYVSGRDGAPAGRVPVRIFVPRPRRLAVRIDNLEVLAPPRTVDVPPTLPGLPPLRDAWDATDVALSALADDEVARLRWAAARAAPAATPAERERAAFLALHGGDARHEATAFPALFPAHGAGCYGAHPRAARYEAHCLGLLRASSGAFLDHAGWRADAVRSAAVLRHVTGLPPLHGARQAARRRGRGPTGDSPAVRAARGYAASHPEQSFHLRWLVGDEEFCRLVPLMLRRMSPEQRRQVHEAALKDQQEESEI